LLLCQAKARQVKTLLPPPRRVLPSPERSQKERNRDRQRKRERETERKREVKIPSVRPPRPEKRREETDDWRSSTTCSSELLGRTFSFPPPRRFPSFCPEGREKKETGVNLTQQASF